MDAAELFEGFVCRPIPPSVKNMTAQGRFAFAGSHAVIDFSIKSEDLPALLSGADLAPAEQGTSSGHPPWTNSSHLIFEKTGKGFDPGNWLFLHVDTNRWLCRIYFGSL